MYIISSLYFQRSSYVRMSHTIPIVPVKWHLWILGKTKHIEWQFIVHFYFLIFCTNSDGKISLTIIYRDYNESYVNIFEPFLRQLTQLTFETMNEALASSKKITVDENYVKIINRTSLRTLMFKARNMSIAMIYEKNFCLKLTGVSLSIFLFLFLRQTFFVLTFLKHAHIETKRLNAAIIFIKCTPNMVFVLVSIHDTSINMMLSRFYWPFGITVIL